MPGRQTTLMIYMIAQEKGIRDYRPYGSVGTEDLLWLG